MNKTDIQDLYRFNYWATHRILDLLGSISSEHYSKDMSSSHGGIHGTLVHMMGAEELWLKRWKGESPTSMYKASDFSSLADVGTRWKIVEENMMIFCTNIADDRDLLRVVAYKDLKGNPYSQPLYQLMQHLVNHSSYHRGQIVTMLRQLGVKPVGTDLVAFFRELA